ncbi:MAG: NUDIX hydrolase [Candidatus Paceibacteria bacterium]
MNIKVYALRGIMSFLRMYWHIWHPKTFGAKMVLKHPEDATYVLLVRHTYRYRMMWSLPGGGYRPRHESSRDAAQREIAEELGVSVHNMTYLTQYYTTAEGKRDTITVYEGTFSDTTHIQLSAEIAEIARIPYTKVEELESLSEIARQSIAEAYT